MRLVSKRVAFGELFQISELALVFEFTENAERSPLGVFLFSAFFCGRSCHRVRNPNLSDSKSRKKAAIETVTVPLVASNCTTKLSESLVNRYREVNSRVALATLFVISNSRCVG